jgi:tRNA 2-thiouridine synthesizing protein A
LIAKRPSKKTASDEILKTRYGKLWRQIMLPEKLDELKAVKVVDARGSACPGPLLEAKKGIGGVPVGEILEIWSGDPGTKNDIPRWAAKIGHEYLGCLAADGYDRIFVRRMK